MMQDSKPVGDQEIESLVSGLDNLQWNLQVQSDVLGLGERAVPTLVKFLLAPAGQFPEGRILAAEVLGHLKGEEAFQGLLRAINPGRFEGLSPILRLSEENVQNVVAKELARIGDRRAIPFLLDALRVRRLVGAVEALVDFHATDSLPWLVEGLEDAFKRDRFSQAILRMGERAIPSLIATLEHRQIYGTQELLPSIERRAEALRLLGFLCAQDAACLIQIALRDTSEKVRREAALALVTVQKGAVVIEAMLILLAGLTDPDFIERDRCVEALIHCGPRCIPVVQETLVVGSVTVLGDTVPFTINARGAALDVLDRLRGLPC